MFIFDRDGIVLDGQTINDLCGLASAYAASSKYGVEISLSLRTATIINNGKIEWAYDLSNKNWEFIRITPNGWNICRKKIIFRRYNNQAQQVEPHNDYELEIFDRFVNLLNINKDDEDTKLLLKCYIISLFIPDIQKVVLMLHGPQGTGKSSLLTLIKMLVDPSVIMTFDFPRDKNELIQQLSHNYLTYYENISTIPEWISNELCRAVTGSGSSKRQLFTDDDDILRKFKRCVGFDGINLGATKADLLDRGLIIKTGDIKIRRKPSEIWKEFEYIKPQLLGYIFDILVKVLNWRNKGPQLDLQLPRMAEFAEYGEIIARCMSYPDGKFIKAYQTNIKSQSEEIIESNQIATCLRDLIFVKYDKPNYIWRGTYSALLTDLETLTEELKIDTKGKFWPKSPNVLSRRINEIIPSLSQAGIRIEVLRSPDAKRTRIVEISKISSEPSGSSKMENFTRTLDAIMDDPDDLDDTFPIIKDYSF